MKTIDFIQTANNRQMFLNLNSEFIEKYSVGETQEFIDYYKTYHVDKNSNWYEGADLKAASTNNALEGTNGVIKSSYTHKDRLPVGRFFGMLQEMIKDWSVERNPTCTNYKPFFLEPSITLNLWTKAFHLAISNFETVEKVFL